MPTTYEPIATTTLSAQSANIYFNSIPSTYTDLRLVMVTTSSGSGNFTRLAFNTDFGVGNFSNTYLNGDGTSATSGRASSQGFIQCDGWVAGSSTTIPTLVTADIFSYAGSTFKTCLITESNDQNGSGESSRTVGLWQGTAAINSIRINRSAGFFSIGSTFTLYGIKNA